MEKHTGNRALILAAGKGTRLGPWTDTRPKALMEFGGETLLEHVIGRLKMDGYEHLLINVHHFADQIMEYVASKNRFGIRIGFSDEREELLDTGGALKKACWFFGNEPFPVYNVDIRSDIDLKKMVRAHREQGALVTMAVTDRPTSRSLLMGEGGLLRGWRDNLSGETLLAGKSGEPLVPVAFSGIQVIEPALTGFFPPEDRFPVIPFYLELAEKHPIWLYRHDGDQWMDMGRKESYETGGTWS